MDKVYIELKVSEEVAEVIANRFSDITTIFGSELKSAGYEKFGLTLTKFEASTEDGFIVVSYPYLRDWQRNLTNAINQAWKISQHLLRNEEISLGDPTLLFVSTLQK